MNEKVINHEENTVLNGLELKMFYNNLSKIACDEFRNAVIDRCGWNYPTWRNRLHSISKITKLESEAIREIMSAYKSFSYDTAK